MPVDEYAGDGEDIVIRCGEPAACIDRYGYYLCQEHAEGYEVRDIPPDPGTRDA